MACPEFEDRLLSLAELEPPERQIVDGHVVSCDSCRALLDALNEVDSQLAAAFADVVAPAGAVREVHECLREQNRLATPSFIPALLDLTGGMAVLAVGLILAAAFLPRLPLDVPFYWTIGTLFVATGLLFAFRSYSELKS